ncbi:hypothetical protein PV518_49660 [Streptomyces sp. ND04-05B]|uniref:hypothetical protein n=1 Tax=Streptomyces sp. ND04-05B TaxID=3028693 RepID=UPI0029B1B363|nr:hypothetical protein [Streptomyces sp. ND04-05B]MDX3070099.1 hypothetical protein [Streptomyces sp. ND04-05B]
MTSMRAASIFTAVLTLVYDEDDWLTIGVDNGTGAKVEVTGQFDDGRIQFNPADVEMLLDFLTRVLASEQPYGIVSVTVPHGDGEPNAWAWHLKDMEWLTPDQALSWLGGEVTYKTGFRLAPDLVTNPDAAPVTEEVKAILHARGLNKDQEPDTTPAAADQSHGTPGTDAGNCAQCARLLIWNGTGKGVHDEWGEYFCSGPRPAGARSAVHVLAAPKTVQPQT